MLSNFGNSLIAVNILITLSIIYSVVFCISNEKQTIPKKIWNFSLYQSTISITIFFTLIAGFIISDFSLVTVFQNSHTLKPLFYKISGTWGNHEGSLLLWINIMIIFSYLFLIYNKNSNKNYLFYTLVIQNILIIGFLLFLFINSNPFSLIFPTPKEGMGLNPILQDPALAIHPPLLYVGFVGSSIYFSAGTASLLSGYNGKEFAKSIKPWILVSWIFQTLGILTGSIWAYYELGWGGFWFWDPVENASLMPWFVMTALMHSVIVLEKRNTLYPWVIILCLLTFILSVTGTFLVRSGVLNSVHTFANDPSRGLYILVFLSLMVFSSLIIFFYKYQKYSYNFNANSKETFILVNNWFMAFFLVTILIGTTYPIFIEVIKKINISVGPPFYNILIIPIIIPFLIFMTFGPKAKWIKNKFSSFKSLTLLVIAATFLNILISNFFKSYSILSNIVITSSIFLILNSVLDLVKIFKKKRSFDFPRIISHLGFGFLVLFIGISHNFSIEKDFNIKIGETKLFKSYEINFESLETETRKNYKAVVGHFNIKNLSNLNEENARPEIRIYNNPETLTYEAFIKSKLTHDIYITMSNINRSEYYNIKFQKKPFMLWIWFSVLMISFGGFLRLIKNEK